MFWLGLWCTPECLPFTVLAYQEALLIPMLEPEKYVLLSDTKADFCPPDIDPCSGGPQEWSPKNELDSEVAFYVHHYKVCKDKGVSHVDQDVLGYPFGIPDCRVCELHTHTCWGESRV